MGLRGWVQVGQPAALVRATGGAGDAPRRDRRRAQHRARIGVHFALCLRVP
jgi:hypothetical protein